MTDSNASQTGEKAVDDSGPLLAKTFGCTAADVARWWSERVKGACCEFLFFGHEKLHSWSCTLKRTLEQAKLLRMWIILVYASWLCRVWLSFRCVAMELTFLSTGAASTGKQRWSASKHFGLPIFQVLCLECSPCQAIQAAIFAMLLRHKMPASCWVQLQHWLLRVWEQRYVWPRKVSWFARQSCPWVAREIFTAGTSQLHWFGFVWSKWCAKSDQAVMYSKKGFEKGTPALSTFHWQSDLDWAKEGCWEELQERAASRPWKDPFWITWSLRG